MFSYILFKILNKLNNVTSQTVNFLSIDYNYVVVFYHKWFELFYVNEITINNEMTKVNLKSILDRLRVIISYPK